MPIQSVVAECVADALRALPKAAFQVRVIQTADHQVPSLTPQKHHTSHFYSTTTFGRRLLVIISQNDTMVAALEAHEFTTVVAEITPPTTSVTVDACIEKLDTSGALAERMPLARALVGGYAASLRRYMGVGTRPNITLSLFARAQPEYLFARSQLNAAKRILDDLGLIKWWMLTLQFAITCSLSHTAVAHCIVPGLDVSEAPWFRQFANQHSAWRWGTQHPLEARAHDCVAQFPDDPMARLLAKEHTDKWTVRMLLDMLAVSEECGAGRRAAYFSVQLEGLPEGGSPDADQGTLSLDDFDRVLVALFDGEMDFSGREAARVSTRKFIDFVDTNSLDPAGPIVAASTGAAHAVPAPAAPAAHAAPPVNDLTMVIRKKRKVAK
ncbi:hypothetical protein FBU59_004984 [Linderina macrospora]|uniref:Uncharacterized protein n=1 Tax=Linderina macrospora TaxID=4868 RepID=A0ACC1J444_9FUNG|nr:hypothetical protein FBU59_004984 [Linderina macrospora]